MISPSWDLSSACEKLKPTITKWMCIIFYSNSPNFQNWIIDLFSYAMSSFLVKSTGNFSLYWLHALSFSCF
jgi:hypothetical protein